MGMIRNQIDIAKRLNREARLEREKRIGRPRANSWGGRPDARKDRRDAKNGLRYCE